MKHYLWELRPYFRHTAGELLLGSICGILMNTLIVLPAVMLGRAIDVTLAFEKHQASLNDVAWAALSFLLGTLALLAVPGSQRLHRLGPLSAKRDWKNLPETGASNRSSRRNDRAGLCRHVA